MKTFLKKKMVASTGSTTLAASPTTFNQTGTNTFSTKFKRLGSALISAVTFIVLLAVLVFSFLFFISCEQQTAPSPKISSFSFTAADNTEVSALQSTVLGDIDDGKKTIRVFLPESLYSDSAQRKLLKPSVEVQDGEILTSGADYSRNPVSFSVGNESQSVTYLVNIEKASSALPANALMFTEYYSEGSALYKGENNQYIEIKNMTSEALDLSQVLLAKTAWKDGTRREDLDQSVNLQGTLPANAILVISSQRSAMFASSRDSATRVFQSDKIYNSILTLSGQDGLALSYNGRILDVLGPDEGKGNGWNWGVAKKMQRKDVVKRYSSWRELEWITTPTVSGAGDITTAGYPTATPTSAQDNTISYFALEGLSHFIYGTIDNTARTITVKMGSDFPKIQKITASTYGQRVKFNGQDIVSGQTEANFSNPFRITVVPSNSTSLSQVYTVAPDFVSYNFNSSPEGTYTLLKNGELPQDGDVVLIYHPTSKNFLGTSKESKGIEAINLDASSGTVDYIDGIASLCVTTETIGGTTYYTFTNIPSGTNNRRYLACEGYKGSTSALRYDPYSSDYSTWRIKDSNRTNGIWLIDCPSAAQGSNTMGMEYYSGGWFTYRSQTGDYYQFQFYKKTN